eukprot:CAMPEP_0204898436 /NCGR_PEP_ID=MMETSP1397-20131031/1284_1 /ASSEMBLY_ACC=CAM_ASM_000891 /TAXON_ID=49980 /ORGANISM="Climacostomum Climacostomum virens, Strain Stock W-24" /LENGTH=314 /DNA_ID=CAMNT_0052066287 /DNA_START=545 /DNA_END=1489 /DNA_ORIENTATION=-
MNEKLATANEFAKETGISELCKKKIINVIKYNTTKVGAIFSDKHALFDDLPKKLKYEVVLSMYKGIVAELPFFKKRDIAFVVYVMPRLRPMPFNDCDYIYHEHEFASEVFVITKGRVNLVDEHGISYKSFLRGSLVGEIELVLKTTRLDSVQVCGDSEFLVMNKASFFSMLTEFPSIAREITTIAKEKAKRNKMAKLELMEILKLKNRGGNLSELAGKENVLSEKQYTPIAVEPDSEERHNEILTKLNDYGNRMACMESRIGRIEQCLDTLVRRLCPQLPNSPTSKTVLSGLLKKRPKRLPPIEVLGQYKEDMQ